LLLEGGLGPSDPRRIFVIFLRIFSKSSSSNFVTFYNFFEKYTLKSHITGPIIAVLPGKRKKILDKRELMLIL
jgi:hypothetical protein